MSDPDQFGYTIFCDDIRDEIGGKLTFVGVYSAALIVHTDFPLHLPKFGMAIRYYERHGSCSDEVTLEISIPGDDENSPSGQGSLNLQEVRRAALENPPDSQYDLAYIHVGTNIIFSPLVIPQQGLIKVRARCGAKIIKLGSLTITKPTTGG